MNKKKYSAILMAVILTFALLLSACSTAAQQNETEVSTSPEASATALGYVEEINKTEIMTFEITVDAVAWQAMLDNAEAEEYISADVTINGTTIKNVGIRPKGNSSLNSIAKDDETDRYSFKIKFDEYVADQTWLGLDKIVLNSNFSDATSMKEYLSYDIMNYIGVDTPLYSYADISVNDKTWGFYLAIEDMDSGYMDRVYNGDGELYKPESMDMGNMQNGEQKVTPPDETTRPPAASSESNNNTSPSANTTQRETRQGQGMPNRQEGSFGGGMGGNGASNGVSLQYTDDEISSYSAIFGNAETKTDETDQQRVIAALKNLSEGTDIETYVDVDAVLKYFAAHTVVVNLDSYVSNMGHNYYLYENNGQINILPWDYNLAFGGFQSGSASDVVNFPIDTPISGVSMEDRPLLGKLLEVPEYLEKYHQYLQEIIDGYFKDGKFEQAVDTLNTLISEQIKNDPSAFYTYEEYQTAIAELKELGALRAESIQGQLDGTIPSTTEGQKADSNNLIDASTIDLTALGTQGGAGDRDGINVRPDGGMNGGQGGFNMPDGLTGENTQAAMTIIQQAQDGELTEEQRTQLHNLGLTDEAITQMLQMPQRGDAPSQGGGGNP